MSLDSFGTIEAHDFMGKDGFVWWIGVVEDNNDPLKLGRARVRIFGFHNENQPDEIRTTSATPNNSAPDGISTNDLPWALALAPLGNSGCPKSPPIASWVLGFFLDGQLAQQPVMLGVLPGYRYQNPVQPGSTRRIPT